MNPQFGTSNTTSDDRLWAALAYFFSPIVPIIILLMPDKKDRPFIKANNMQALVLGIAAWIVTSIVGSITCGIGFIVWFLMLIPTLKAYKGEVPEIPVISNFVRQQGW